MGFAFFHAGTSEGAEETAGGSAASSADQCRCQPAGGNEGADAGNGQHADAGEQSSPASAPRAPRAACALRPPRTGTKQETVLTLLRRDEGATIAQVIDATGWQQHTVRGFLAGLKRRGITVEVLKRVRQVGPNKQGAKGSYSIYRIAPATTAPAEAG
ncbi:DUF3489 domain-containing protein [Neoroseomonas lacus]|nr:DUF3489 domain-containing protein [Neoroseomonas lacus]